MSVATRTSRILFNRPRLPQVVVLQFAGFTARGDLKDRDTYIRLLNVRGWPATAISIAARMTRREVVAVLRQRERISAPVLIGASERFETPAPKATRYQTYGRAMVTRKAPPTRDIPPDILDKLRELKPLATSSTGNSRAYLDESVEYTRLLWLLHSPKEIGGYGISIDKIAAAVAQSSTAIRNRLTRYGYLATSATVQHGGIQPITTKPIR